MVKYCTGCGAENDGQAIFCISCGQKFPEQPSPQIAQPGAPAGAQSPSVFTAEIGPGAHQHMLTDVYLRDASGNLTLVAKRQSMLHMDYDLADGNGTVVGFIEPKTHMTHRSLILKDASHNTQAIVQLSSLQQRGALPNCWIEDAGGGKEVSILFTNGLLGFSGVKADGSSIFEGSFNAGAGLGQTLGALNRGSNSIKLLDPAYPLPLPVTTIVALDHNTLA